MVETFEGVLKRRRLQRAGRVTEEELQAQQEAMHLSDERPDPVYVRYTGSEPLYHDGRAPKLEGGYLFTPGSSVAIRGVPRDENGRVILFADEDAAAAWDMADIEFFERKARQNPETWQIVEKPEPVIAPAAEPKKKRKRGGS